MNRPTIVAELSANVTTSLSIALQTVEAAAHAGADAIKLQTWTPGTMVLDRSYVIKSGAWKGRSLANLYEEAWTPWDWHRPIFERARDLGMEAWSTPFDTNAVGFLEALDCPRYKIASFEILDLDLIRACAATGKPIIISTGMAQLSEIVAAGRAAEPSKVTLLKCTSAYPASPSEANLATMAGLKAFGAVGLSDHTIGSAVAVAATILGATVIEKHFILDRRMGGPDAHFSANPQEFADLVKNCRDASAAIGKLHFGPTEGESTELRRGLYWAKDLPADHVVQATDMVTARPATPASPADKHLIIGRKLAAAVRRGDPLRFDL
jgi:pseudaminic acid synthase